MTANGGYIFLPEVDVPTPLFRKSERQKILCSCRLTPSRLNQSQNHSEITTVNVTQLIKDCLPSVDANASAAATTAVTSAVALDMAGYDGIMYICSLGTVTSGSVLTLTTYGATTSTASGGVAITGGATSPVTDAGASSNKLLIVDVLRPSTRYVYATLTRTTQNAVVNGIIAVRYKTRSVPVTADASVLASAVCVIN